MILQMQEEAIELNTQLFTQIFNSKFDLFDDEDKLKLYSEIKLRIKVSNSPLKCLFALFLTKIYNFYLPELE